MSLKHKNGPKAESVQVPRKNTKNLTSLIHFQTNFSFDLLLIVIQKYLQLLEVGGGVKQGEIFTTKGSERDAGVELA